MFEKDAQGKWRVTEGRACKIRLLVKPSKAFLDWQASNPIVEPEPVRDLASEIDELKIEVDKLKKGGEL